MENIRKIVRVIIILLVVFVVIPFLAYFIYGLANKKNIDKIIKAKEKLIPLVTELPKLNRPLKDFYIATSHNSYIGRNQNADVSDPKYVKQAMLMGARAIELDVFSKNNTSSLAETRNIPIVAHGIERCGDSNDTKLCEKSDIFVTFHNRPLADYCKTISDTLPSIKNDPLFIFIENNTNTITSLNDVMADIFIEHFGDKLLTPATLHTAMATSFGTTNNLTNVPMKYFVGKVILITGGGCRGKFCDITFTYSGWLNNYTNKSKNIVGNPDKLIRIYPDMESNIFQIAKSHFSFNYNPTPFLDANCQFVALNYGIDDDNLDKYLEFFDDSSFIVIPKK